VIGSSALRVLKYQHSQPEVDNGDMHIPYGGKHWVVLVAGSDGWWNYRHQVFKENELILMKISIIARL